MNRIPALSLLCSALFFISFHQSLAQDHSKFTENDWINYAKAQGNSYPFSYESIEKIIGNARGHYFIDSMARISIFDPLFYEGKEIRKSNLKAPVLSGRVAYYYLTGQLATQMDFENDMRNGKHYIYYTNGQIAQIQKFKDDQILLRDTVKEFSINGKLIGEEFETDSLSISRFYSYEEGKLLFESIERVFDSNQMSSKSYFDLEAKEEKSFSFDEKKYQQNFYDLKGKKINFLRWMPIGKREIDIRSKVESSNGLFRLENENINVPDQYLIDDFYRRRRISLKRFSLGLSRHEIFSSCVNCKSLIFIDSTLQRNYRYHADFPNTFLVDTLFCEPEKQMVRTAETKEGKLNGKLEYYYPSGQKWAEFNFKDDYQDGVWMVYDERGKIKSKGRKSMGVPQDSTFEYYHSGAMRKLIEYKDSTHYQTKFYWEDGKTIQRMEEVNGSIEVVRVINGLKKVESKMYQEFRYYNKQGEEISKKQFEKNYPGILPKVDPRKTRAQF